MFDEINLMKEIIKLVEQQWVTEIDFENIPDKHGVYELNEKIFFMNSIKNIIRDIPEEIFGDNVEAKQSMLSAIDECLDEYALCENEEEDDDDIY